MGVMLREVWRTAMKKNESVTNRVVAYIRDQILSGAWPLGSKLPSENQLCKELGCSRISIRSALQQFIAIGAVESVHGKGSFLRSADLQLLGRTEPLSIQTALTDILDLISFAWPGVCIQAAQLDQGSLLHSLQEIVAQMQSTPLDRAEEMADLVYRFHQAIALSLPSEILHRLSSSLLNFLKQYPCNGDPSTIYYGVIYHHNLLLTAMEQKDPTRIYNAVLDYSNHIRQDFYHLPSGEEANLPSGSAPPTPPTPSA